MHGRWGGRALVALVLFCSYARASRILFYTCPGCTSHQLEILAISDELQKRGHETKLLLPNWDLELRLGPKLLLTHNASFIVHHPYKDVHEGRRRYDTFIKSLGAKTVKDVKIVYYSLYEECETLLTDADALAKLAAFKPDIIVGDMFTDCRYTLIDILKTPHILFQPSMVAEPTMSIHCSYLTRPSTVPAYSTGLATPMTFLDRLRNWAGHQEVTMVALTFRVLHGILRRRLGLPFTLHTPPPRLVLANTAFPMETLRALPDGVKLVGPLLAKPAQPLTGALADLAASSAPDGFVYVSFGTTHSMASATSLRTLAAALASLNRTVLWQISERALPEGVTMDDLQLGPAVHPVAWTPQNDVLGSPHVAAFITHGGLNGALEAMYHGVPLISIPLAVDHPDAAARTESWGMGIVVSKRTLARGDPRPLVAAVQRVIEEPSFRVRAREAGALLRAHPVPPAVRAAEWVEAALAMPPGTGLPVHDPAASLWWFVRESHDVHLALALVAAAVVAAGRLARRALRRPIFKRKKA